jgi:predicted CoA-binding protein
MKKNLALFGLSRKEKSVSRDVYKLLNDKGYHIYPVNPNAEKIDSISCHKSLDDIKTTLDGAIIITNPKISHTIVRQCQEKGITDLWFQYDTMDDALRSYCQENGINYIYSCVLLHHKESGFPHSWHRFFYRLFKR